MAVPRRILTVFIRSVTLFETGDRKVPEAQNSINALLVYPTPGQAEVFATTGLVAGIEDGKPTRFTPPLILLKQAVQGPTDLNVVITDRDDRNGLVTFLRRMAGTVTGSAGTVVSAELPGIFRAAFREAVASGQLAIGGSKEDKLEVVATGTLPIRDAAEVKGAVTLQLIAPRELRRTSEPNIAKGAANGTLELELLWDEG
jgi:hypothetical protein